MTHELNVFHTQPHKTKNQTFEVSFIEDNCVDSKDESQFCDSLQEPPIDLSFEDLFADEIMCLDESTRGKLADCPLTDVDLSFEELYGEELKFLDIRSDEILRESGDKEFICEQCGGMSVNENNNQLNLETPRATQIIYTVSQLSSRKQTHWNDGKRARGKRPKA